MVRWENAGFDKNNCHVYSNKVGWEHFNQVIVAAYMLEELYLDGSAVAVVDGEHVLSLASMKYSDILKQESLLNI